MGHFALSDFVNEAFESLVEVPIMSPFPGGRFRIWVRHVSTSTFVTQLDKHKVEPKTATRKIDESQDPTAQLRLAIESFNGMPEGESASSIGWNKVYPELTVDEIEKIKVQAGKLLVARIEELDDDDNVTRQLAKKEYTPVFASKRPLRKTLPSNTDPSKAVPVPLSEVPGLTEGGAYAAVVLRAAVQDHLFLKRLDPLDGTSSASDAGEATRSENESSPSSSTPS